MSRAVAGLVVALVLAPAPCRAEGGVKGTKRLYSVRGAKLYTQTFGSGAPIVFLHGGLHHFDNSFAQQRDYFSSFRKVIGIDQRGHGHSPDDPRPFSYQEMAEDTAALVEQLGLGPVDVVGHSDGANVALLLARDHPSLVRSLVVSGANLRAGPTTDEARQHRQESVEEAAARLPPLFREEYLKVTPDGADHWLTVVAKSRQLWLTPVILEPADLKTINIPVLVMAGDHDFRSIEEYLEIYRALPKGELFIVPATGHGTFARRPELVNQAIRTFLEHPGLTP